MQDERLGLPSASNLDRIYRCPGSFALEQSQPELPEKEEAKIGKLIHAVLAGEISIDALAVADQWLVEQCKKTEEYLITTIFAGSKVEVHNEQRLWYEVSGLKIFSGQIDKLYIDPVHGQALIIDYKTGWNPVKNASQNIQLMAYALLVSHNYDVNSIYVGIIQPRTQDGYELCQYLPSDTQTAEKVIGNAILKSYEPTAERNPGAEQCRYCKAKGVCPEAIDLLDRQIDRVEEKLNVSIEFKPKPDELEAKIKSLTPEERSRFLKAYELFKLIAEAIRNDTKELMEKGQIHIRDYRISTPSQRREFSSAITFFQNLRKMYPDLKPEEFDRICTINLKDAQELVKEKSGEKGKKVLEIFEKVTQGAIITKQQRGKLEREAA